MKKIGLALAAVLAMGLSSALAQGGPGGGGPGPGPVPDPWVVNGALIYYPNGGVNVGPGSLANEGVGTVNVSGGYYINGVQVNGVVSATEPILYNVGTGVVSFDYSHSGTFTAVQTVNLNAASLPSALTGTVFRIGQANATISRLEIDSFGTASPGVLSVVYGRGTAAAPTAVQSGDEIGSFNTWGYTGAGTLSGTAVAAFRTYAAENFSSGHQGSKSCIASTAIASTTLTVNLCVNNDGGTTIGAPTGGSQGANTLNAGGLYINGVALSTSAGNLTVGTSTISSGTNARILYDASGILGEYTITGTAGSVVMSQAPTIVGGSITALTTLAIRDTSAAFDVTIAAVSNTALTAGRTFTLNMQNVAHILTLGTTASTGSGIIFPNTASDTVAMLGVSNVFSQFMSIQTPGSDNTSFRLLQGSSSAFGWSMFANAASGQFSFRRYASSADGSDAIQFFASGTASTTSTTGTLVVTGGVGISGAVNIGSTLSATLAATTEANMVCYNSSTGLMTYSTIAQQCTVSSARFKDAIEVIARQESLNIIDAMRPVSFVYKPEMDLGGDRHLGLLAEEVAEIAPELVIYDGQGHPKAIKQTELKFRMIGAIQQLKVNNDNLRTANDNLERRLRRLESGRR